MDAAGSDGNTTSTVPTSYSADISVPGSGLTSPVHLIEWPSTALSPIEHWQNAGVDATDPRKQRSENSPATPRPKKHASTTGAPTPHSTIRKAKSLGRLNGTPLQSPIKDGTSPRQAPPEVPTSPTKTLGRQSQALRLHTAQRAAERGIGAALRRRRLPSTTSGLYGAVERNPFPRRRYGEATRTRRRRVP